MSHYLGLHFKDYSCIKVYDVALNKETIDWTQSFTGLGGNGYLVSVNIAGLPAMVQPCGFDSNKLPIGMQLIGPRFGEQKLVNAGLAFEKASGLSNIVAL